MSRGRQQDIYRAALVRKGTDLATQARDVERDTLSSARGVAGEYVRAEQIARLRVVIAALPEEGGLRWVRSLAWLEGDPHRTLSPSFQESLSRVEALIRMGNHLTPMSPERLATIQARSRSRRFRDFERRDERAAVLGAAFKAEGEPPPVPPSRRSS